MPKSEMGNYAQNVIEIIPKTLQKWTKNATFSLFLLKMGLPPTTPRSKKKYPPVRGVIRGVVSTPRPISYGG